jgi:hypothetical protein
MDQGSTGNEPVNSASPQSSAVRTPRSVWVLTAYGIAGLALFGVLAYYFSSYIAR